MHVDTQFATTSRRPGIFERLALDALARTSAGRLILQRPDGSCLSFGGDAPGTHASVAVRHPRAYRRLLVGGALALAESYMDGDWDSPDLTEVVRFGAVNGDRLATTLRGVPGSSVWRGIHHALRPNSLRGARRNIAAHYDLGNDFYAAWLDPTLTYSAGMFADTGDNDLVAAQARKFHRIAGLADIRPGDEVLEIGCGWGGFACWAARNLGCRVTAITLSRAQAAHVRALVEARGLGGKVDVRLQDYREVDGTFDRIVSIEMLEAVGEAYWPVFFRVLHDRLKPGGRAALQVITMADDRFAVYRRRVDFIQKYIFPGGMLPSPSVLREAADAAELQQTGASGHADDYARTLALWRDAFEDALPRIAGLGFDERFQRMWRYYLAYCEAGFREGRTDLLQIGLRRGCEAAG